MPILRANALRSLQSSLRHSSVRAGARVVAPARTQIVAKRFASSGGHGSHESSSDIPWMIGALVVTPPTMWYLWPEAHDDHHEEHGHQEHGSDEEEKPSEEEEESAPEEDAPKEEDASAEKSDDSEKESGEESKEGEDKGSEEDSKASDSKDEEKEGGDDKEQDENKDESSEKGSKKGSTGKGKMSEDSDGNSDTRKSEPRPSKGSNVKRIDSGLGKNLGEGQTYKEDDPKKETQATSKDAGSSTGDISNKQKGLSTTDTRHSTQIDQDPEKSKKGSGEPETAKAKGTVDPNAPAR